MSEEIGQVGHDGIIELLVGTMVATRHSLPAKMWVRVTFQDIPNGRYAIDVKPITAKELCDHELLLDAGWNKLGIKDKARLVHLV